MEPSRQPSGVPFSYTTIMATKSRIDKGLLAIPVSLINLFPKTSGHVYLLSESGSWARKSFTAYDSSSKECRIGGMRDFYERHGTQNGDELVLHVHDNGRYELLPEALFQRRVLDLESRFDHAPTQPEAEAAITELAAFTRTTPDDVVRSEYVRLASQDVLRRATKTRSDVKTREHIPPSLRKLLTELYHGRCQVSGFSFLKKTGGPYFEVHHINPFQGNHVKNVLVVSPNVHAQFTYAYVEQAFDASGWLRQVKFNSQGYPVFQMADQLPAMYRKEVHSV